MPNDAKLGLLVGVVGVIVVAVMSGKRLPQAQTAANVPSAVQKAVVAKAPVPEKLVVQPNAEKPAPKLVPVVETQPEPIPAPHDAPAVFPVELPSTPVVRTKRQPVATPTSLPRGDNEP